ncbi:MAG TPA: hypothetical protein VI702_03010, partial [Nitrospiria bacterium]
MSLKPDIQREIRGWLFDVYPASGGMVLWVITEEGRRLRLVDPFHPSFYFEGPPGESRRAFSLLSREATPVTARPVERMEFFSGKPIPVVQVTVEDPMEFPAIVGKLTRLGDRLRFYTCDINPAQLYFYERNVFPLAFCSIECGDGAAVRSIRALDSPWDLDYSLPPLRVMQIRMEGDRSNPNHGTRGRLEILDGQGGRVLEGDDAAELVIGLNQRLHQDDPDLIFTEWGDSFIIPHLRRLAEGCGIPIAFNRDVQKMVAGKKARSYASYGRMVHNAGAQTFFGRWHIDRRNSFVLNEAKLEGLFEQARVTKLPIQHAARTSTGTGITSMQLETAHREGILIPCQKRQPEEFKSGYELLTIDKGGMVFLPPVG